MYQTPKIWLWVLTLLFGLTTAATSSAAGLLTPSDGSLPPLELKTHQVNVVIENGYAVTTIEQMFHNPHARDLEATYSFPVPEHGTVGEFTLWIDGKPVTGEVLEKQQARRLYEEEKSAGRDAGITEKDGYKTFEVKVAPVRAGQDTRTRLVYYQAAFVDTGIGRYVYPLEEGGVDEQKLAFWTANDKVSTHFSFDLELRSGYPVDAVRVPNQAQAQIKQNGPSHWHVHLGDQSPASPDAEPGASPSNTSSSGPGAVFTLDKDLVVYWRHQQGLPGSVDLVTQRPDPKKPGTFMLTLTPGDDLQPINRGTDWVFILDISGSMQGKYATLTDGVQRALGKMRSDDRFRIVLFNNTASELTHGYVDATPQAVQQYSEAVARIKPGQSTNLYAGLRLGLDALDADRTSGIVLVTDGVANVGETAQKGFIELLKKKDVRLFTFIMGNSANRPLLDALAKTSGGFALSISNSDDIVGQILNATNKVTHQALHGVKLSISGVKVSDLTPNAIGSLYRGQQLVVLGHYHGDGQAQVSLSGRISGHDKRYTSTFNFPATSHADPELERLWAYAKVEELQQQMDNFGTSDDVQRAATDLSLEYGLVTDRTSMVVMREAQFAAHNIQRNNAVRVATEQQARQQRAQQAPMSHRVDTNQPMFSGSRAGHGGGGAMGIWGMGVLLLLVARSRYRESRQATR